MLCHMSVTLLVIFIPLPCSFFHPSLLEILREVTMIELHSDLDTSLISPPSFYRGGANVLKFSLILDLEALHFRN